MKSRERKYFFDNKVPRQESNPELNLLVGTRQRASAEFDLSPAKVLSCYSPRESERNILIEKAFPNGQAALRETVLVETIRDRKNWGKYLFLLRRGGSIKIMSPFLQAGKLIAPCESDFQSVADLRLPDRILPYGGLETLFLEISSTISEFIDLSEKDLFLVTAFILSIWFPDCVQAVPYLWIVGALGTGKTKLLRLLNCFCRRALLVGDLSGASLYKLSSLLKSTLLIDEFEPGNSKKDTDMLRLLRTGSVPSVPAARNGQLFTTFGAKVIASRQPPVDTALASRALLIRMFPTPKNLMPLDQAAIERIADQFQPRLLMFRLKNHSRVESFQIQSVLLESLSPRMKDLARALAAPLCGNKEYTETLLAILREHDRDAAIERCLEPEWLVVEALFRLCHKGMADDRLISEMTVGWVADHINGMLEFRGEDLKFTARKVGATLKSLGIKTQLLGNIGRGLRFTSILREKIHELARQFGFDRRNLTPLSSADYGYGGVPCALCEDFGLTGGLRFVYLKRKDSRVSRPNPRGPLFSKRDRI